MTVNDQ